jgi:hypothetical protein
LWVFGPFIALLCSAEVEAYFHLVIHRTFSLAYTYIIAYTLLSIPSISIMDGGIKRKENGRKKRKAKETKRKRR